jgi:crotonobetainyl-CoA:carnitine CoA-transferase CaiB-like acyl-CoA transferase
LKVKGAAAGDDQWARLRRVLGDPAWAAEPALATHGGRRAAHDLLDRKLSAWFAGRDRDAVVEELAAAGIPAAPVVLPPDVVDNVQLRARASSRRSTIRTPGPPSTPACPSPGFVGSTVGAAGRPPRSDSTNDEVLGGELGLSAEELDGLRESRVIGDRPVGL